MAGGVWAVGFKFSPEGVIVGGPDQVRFQIVCILIGGFVGLMLGLAVSEVKSPGHEKRKFLYSALGFGSLGVALTWGPSVSRWILGAFVGAVCGLAIATVNQFVERRRVAKASKYD